MSIHTHLRDTLQVSKEEVHNAIVSKEPCMPSQLPEQCADFVRQCLRKDAATRPTAEELYRHPWVVRFTHGLSVFHNSPKPVATKPAPAHGPLLSKSSDRCILDVAEQCAASVRLATEAIQESTSLDAMSGDTAPAPVAEKHAVGAVGPALVEAPSLESTMSVASAVTLHAAANSAGAEPADSSKILAWHVRADEAPASAEQRTATARLQGACQDSATVCTGACSTQMAVAGSPGELTSPPKGVAIGGGNDSDLSRHFHSC